MAGDCSAGVRSKPMASSRTTSFAATNSASDCTTSTLALEVHQRRYNDLRYSSRSGVTADEIQRRDIIDTTQTSGGGSLGSVLEPRSAREMKIKDVGSARRRLFWGGRNNLPRQATPYLPGRSLLRAAHL
jgi:hypothetical protein